MTRILSLLLIAGLLLPATVAAAEPTLGARLSPNKLVVEREQVISLTNKSSVTVRVRFEATNGWVLGETLSVLEPDQETRVTISEAPDTDAVIRAILSPLKVPPGQDAASLILETQARHLQWWEQIPPIAWILVLAASAVLALGVRRLGPIRRRG